MFEKLFVQLNETVVEQELTPSQWAKISQYLRREGYDIRGGEDAKQLYQHSLERGYDLFQQQEDWKDAYELATTGKRKKETKQPTEHIDFERVKELGTTDNPEEAGYLTPDGKFIDLSGKREGGQPGTRSFDHREVGGTEGMLEFMNLGNIRLMPESGAIDIMQPLTPKQRSKLEQWIDYRGGDVGVELQDGLGKWDKYSQRYAQAGRRTYLDFDKGTDARKVLNVIDRFFKGQDVSLMTQYRESKEQDDFNGLLEKLDFSDKYPEAKGRWSEDVLYDWHDMQDETFVSIVQEYMDNIDNPDYRQSWRLVPAGRLKKIWQDYARFGFVRDEKGIDMIKEIVIENIHKIAVNNILTGHTPANPERYAKDFFDIDFEDGYFDILDIFFDDEKGNWRLSDYAMDDLNRNGMLLLEAKSPEEKLLIIDRILNIVHQRSDLASWFVEGGRQTLNALAVE